MDLKADAVILTTPPGFRPEEFKTAVAAGKRIFMEKPIAVDTWGCRSVLDTAEKAKAKKLSVVVGLQRRYSTAYREAQKRIASGALGTIVSGRGFYLTQDVWRGKTWPRADYPSELHWMTKKWHLHNHPWAGGRLSPQGSGMEKALERKPEAGAQSLQGDLEIRL